MLDLTLATATSMIYRRHGKLSALNKKRIPSTINRQEHARKKAASTVDSGTMLILSLCGCQEFNRDLPNDKPMHFTRTYEHDPIFLASTNKASNNRYPKQSIAKYQQRKSFARTSRGLMDEITYYPTRGHQLTLGSHVMNLLEFTSSTGERASTRERREIG